MLTTIKEYKKLIAKQPRKNKKPEAGFQKAVAEYLLLKGFTVMRVNSSAMTAESGTFLRSYYVYGRGNKDASSGFPDLIAFKGDKFIVIETKAKNGKLRDSQKSFKEFWEGRKHQYNVVSKLDELINIIG